MEKTDGAVAKLIEKLQEVGFNQAPEVIEGAIRAIYWDGLVQATTASVLIGLLISSVMIAVFGAKRDNDNTLVSGIMCSAFTLFITIPVALIGNPWLKLFDPEAYFYREIVMGIL